MRKTITLFAASILLMSGLLIWLPQAHAEVGGASLEEATLVGEGEHDLGIIEDTFSKYVKISVRAGQRLEATVESNGFDRMGEFRVFSPPDKRLVWEKNYHPFPQTAIFAPGNLDNSRGGEVYLEVKNRQGGEEGRRPVSVKMKLTDVSDANSGSDAGDSFSRALKIQSGQLKGYLSAGVKSFDEVDYIKGTDLVDMYVVSLQKGDKLTISAAPHETVRLNLKTYDAARKIVAEQTSENTGAIATARFIASRAQDAFFAIRPARGNSTDDSPGDHFYDLSVNVEPGTVDGGQAPPAGVPTEVETLRPGKASRSGEKTFKLEAAANRVVSLRVTSAAGQGTPEFVVLNSDGKIPPQYAVQHANGSRELQVKANGRNTRIVKGKGTFYVTVKAMGDYVVEHKALAKSCL